jgi:hypothetical protein
MGRDDEQRERREERRHGVEVLGDRGAWGERAVEPDRREERQRGREHEGQAEVA